MSRAAASAADFLPTRRSLPALRRAAVTIYPSAILRLRDRDEREEPLGALVADLSTVREAVSSTCVQA